jgi:hypothetical protein
MNEISTYKGNSKVISVYVPSGATIYSGYSLTFSVNDKEFFDGSNVITKTGLTVTSNYVTVSVTATENDITPAVYFYQVDISKDEYKFTIAGNSYTVLPSIT